MISPNHRLRLISAYSMLWKIFWIQTPRRKCSVFVFQLIGHRILETVSEKLLRDPFILFLRWQTYTVKIELITPRNNRPPEISTFTGARHLFFTVVPGKWICVCQNIHVSSKVWFCTVDQSITNYFPSSAPRKSNRIEKERRPEVSDPPLIVWNIERRVLVWFLRYFTAASNFFPLFLVFSFPTRKHFQGISNWKAFPLWIVFL